MGVKTDGVMSLHEGCRRHVRDRKAAVGPDRDVAVSCCYPEHELHPIKPSTMNRPIPVSYSFIKKNFQNIHTKYHIPDSLNSMLHSMIIQSGKKLLHGLLEGSGRDTNENAVVNTSSSIR